MKTALLWLSVVLLGSAALAQTPLNRSMALVVKASGTWCGGCGEWGWDLQERIVEDNSINTPPHGVVLVAYAGGGNYCTNPWAGLDGFFSGGRPCWGVNNINRTYALSINNVDTVAFRSTIKTAVDSFAKIAPTVSTGFSYKIDDTSIVVNTKTRFWKSANYFYYLAIYIVEDSIRGYQEGRTDTPLHNNVIRGFIGTDVRGDQISPFWALAGQTFSKTYRYRITDSTWNPAHVKLATVIWRDSRNLLQFENANDQQDQPTQVENIQRNNQFVIKPNPASGIMNIENLAGNNYSFTLVDMLGQAVYKGSGRGFSKAFDVSALASGLYALNIWCEGTMHCMKLVKQ